VRRASVSAEAAVTDDGAVLLGSERVPERELCWLTPPHGMVIGAALNLRAQLAELDAVFNAPPYHAPPRAPVLFIKPENTLIAHRAPVLMPPGAVAIQPGAALAVIIGRRARCVSRTGALAVVKGYSLFNDFSLPERDWFRPPVAAKCFDGAGCLGPFRTDAGRVPDPGALELRTLINGELRQRTALNGLYRDIPALIEAVTDFMTLNEDDILFTGLPAARIDVGPGDEVAVEADGLGRLVNRIVAAVAS
jgi:5-oxopent-3-ene-1,2,5-tricarboxylate decarboxylase/2-hydroxyhepta-2,4-diene-1,7-dioate isomerase